MIRRAQTTTDVALPTRELTGRLRAIALRALQRMYRPQDRLFGFCIRRTREGDVLEGVSRRYTATALIGLATEPEDVARDVLAGQGPREVCQGLLDEVQTFQDIGEVALTLWAARLLGCGNASEALARLRQMDPVHGHWPTVETAWCLTALSVPGPNLGSAALAGVLAERLLRSFQERSGLFPHWPVGARSPFLRRHVSCFADFIYPVQALSCYHIATGSQAALDAAAKSARTMCRLQGPAGQWWWHFDVRTGRVIERYPVYSVHQDSMAPMALQALRAAGGPDHGPAIEKGLAWLAQPTEIQHSLVDTEADLIWRKVARREKGKLARKAQALASRIHPAMRAPGVGLLCRPKAVDFESRPYHMGWILHAWRTD